MTFTINGEQLSYRKLVTIDGSMVTTNTGIPLGLNINLPGVKANGADVRLATLDNMPIAREIECTNVPNADNVMIWYPFNTTGGTYSQFYVYWGNAALTEPAANSTFGKNNVWSSGYKHVVHYNQEPHASGANAILDSTSNAKHGTVSGFSSNSLVNTNYAKGITTTSSSDQINFGNAFGITEITTILLLLKTTCTISSAILQKYGGGDTINVPTINLISDGTVTIYYDINGGHPWQYRSSSGVINSGSETVLVMQIVSGTSFDIYINGSLSNGTFVGPVSATGTNNYPLLVPVAGSFTGTFIEERTYAGSMSSNYITTVSTNLKNPTASGTVPFYSSFGSSESTGSISFISIPAGARIWLGSPLVDQGAGKVTPYIITDLIPGTYDYKLVLSGYTDLTGTAVVSSGTQTDKDLTMLTVANITATDMTITKSENPCRIGICTLSVSVTWTNSGQTAGSSNLSITVSGGTPTITPSSYPSVSFAANGTYGYTIIETFTVSGMTAGTCSICPNPN